MNKTIDITPIERTPNIGQTLAGELKSLGIDSLEALMRVGFWDAWLQLRRANPDRDAVPACLALAGAVAGGGWSPLPPGARADTRRRVKAGRTCAPAARWRSPWPP